MSTIVYDRDWIVSDTGMTCCRANRCDKLVQLDGPLFQAAGGCGSANTVMAFIEWCIRVNKAGERKHFPPIIMDDENSELVAVNMAGELELYQQYWRRPISQGSHPIAFGSGDQYALGAMKAGVSARKALRIAMELDAHTFGKAIEIKISKN